VAHAAASQPSVDVLLGEPGKRETALAEPGQELKRDGYLNTKSSAGVIRGSTPTVGLLPGPA
jgi:hypothetical protein